MYDKCGKALHTLNPYNKNKIINLKRSVNDWVNRIIKLLYIHQVSLVDDSETFVVYLQHPDTNKVKAIRAVAIDQEQLNK